jgi:hypothetical protein
MCSLFIHLGDCSFRIDLNVVAAAGEVGEYLMILLSAINSQARIRSIRF